MRGDRPEPAAAPPAVGPPDVVRGLTMPRAGGPSRRCLLQLGGLAALGLPLAACGISGTGNVGKVPGGLPDLVRTQAQIAAYWARQKKTGRLDFANWPLYIDVTKSGDHPSLDEFTRKTGIKVTYAVPINDVDSYYAKISPLLAAGQGTGYDIIVMTNGTYLEDLIERNWLIPLDQSAMPNFYANASDLVRDQSYDRGNVFTMAWQSGITGIGYSKKRLGREITSWSDLTDPTLKGRIGMFGDTTDLPNVALCAIGVNPERSTRADWTKAADWLVRQRPLVRKYYEQDYIAPLTRGDLYASMAWSGDIFQANANGADLDFAVPKEGAPIWTDNMCIPLHAAHPRDAMTYMDYVYQPAVAAVIADGVNYITPVPGAQAIFAREAKEATSTDDRQYYAGLSTSPLIFPTAADQQRLHRYRVLAGQQEVDAWNHLFEPIFQS